MTTTRIMIIEDNVKICNMVKTYGERKFGYTIDYAHTISSARALLEKNKYDLITLDINLNDENGLKEIDNIKKDFSGPILIVSGIDDTDLIVEGFNKGADDYIIKPFLLPELFARIKRSITRANEYQLLTIDCYVVDKVRNEVFKDGQKLKIKGNTVKVFIVLLENKGKLVSREDIFKEIWVGNYSYSSRVIDTYVSQIRKVAEERRIRGVRGEGYIFDA